MQEQQPGESSASADLDITPAPSRGPYRAVPARSPSPGPPPPVVGTSSTTAPATAPAESSAAVADVAPPSLTTWQKLRASEDKWLPKAILRAIAIIVDIIGIAAVAVMANRHIQNGPSPDYPVDSDEYNTVGKEVLLSIIAFGVSLLFCLVLLLLPLRRPWRGVHPGIAVGADLILWLGFIVLSLYLAFDTTLYYDPTDGSDIVEDSDFDGRDYSGYYTHLPNGTWSYTITSYWGVDYVRTTYTELTYGIRSTASSAAGVTVSATVTTSTPTTTLDTPSLLRRAVNTNSDDGDDGSDGFTPYASLPTATYTYGASELSIQSSLRRAIATESASSDYGSDDGSDGDAYEYEFYTHTVTVSEGSLATVTRTCTPTFSSCVQQDAFVNEILNGWDRQRALSILAVVASSLMVLLHFVLFVWACVDTHRRNRRQRARTLTLSVIQDLHQQGYVVVRAPMPEGVGNEIFRDSAGAAGAAAKENNSQQAYFAK